MKTLAGVIAVLLVCLSASGAVAQQQPQPLTLKEARQIALANRPLVRCGGSVG